MKLHLITKKCSRLVVSAGLTVMLLGTSLNAASAAKPKLIVQITMDQLRGDLLRMYSPALNGGFRRLEAGGYWIRKGDVNFGLTLSFLGHTTLATGMYPSHHGLTANEWWLQQDGQWKEVDVTDDPAYQIVGSPAARIGASPKNLLVTTIGEWVMEQDPRAKAIAVGTGTRIPIAYAGHKGSAIWYDTVQNRFTTSTYYGSTLPVWVRAFNEQQLEKFEKQEWALTVPKRYVALARQEPTYEGKVMNGPFPHTFQRESAARGGQPYERWFGGTPMKDEALFALAEAAVDAEQLGQRHSTDYLAIDVDSTDSVGHRYGPRSLEQLDALYRLDGALGSLLDHLDHALGKESYVLVLSADHGVSDSPGHYPGGRKVAANEIDHLLDEVETVVREEHGSGDDLKKRIIAVLKSADFVADAYSEDELAHPSSDYYVQLYSRCFRRGLTTDFPLWSDQARPNHPAKYGIIARFKKGMILYAATGVHGSPYEYDRDVPIIFYGAHVKHGTRATGAKTVDVAPTLAAAAGIPMPAALDGHALAYAIQAKQ